MNFVRSFSTLEKMSQLGHIELAPETGCKIGKKTIYYVRGTLNGTFEYKGRRYKETYLSGCFYPFIESIN